MKDFYELTDIGRARRLRPIAETVLNEYDLEVVRMRSMSDATNGVFRLDCANGDRFAMRVGAGPPIGHSADEMRSEMEWLDALCTIETPAVPRPVPSRTGEVVVMGSAPNVPYDPPCAIFTWLDGSLLADRLDEVSFDKYGAAMANLHRAAIGFEPRSGFVAPKYTTVYPYESPFIVFSEADGDLLPPTRRSLFEKGLGLVQELFGSLPSREPMRLLHGDLHGWNVKTDHGRVSVFDFEDMVWGWPVQDIGVALYYYWQRDDFDQKLHEFRSGYQTVSPWPDSGGEVFTCIIARTLLMANDVISQPEWLEVASEVYERGERRIRDMLDRMNS
ncbi:MAG: phosphotransferase [Acidimicrobiia bacterium]|nr:phosphotransferase [Acidimicrobiia bacterium]MDH3396289.1 phosphotransferase [Acidimicrobiia bacterium]